MSQFEFILIIISIVTGITISEMLVSISRGLLFGKLSLRTGPYYLATIFLLFLATRYVWVLWDFRLVQWDFWNFLLLLSPVLMLAIVAHVLAIPRVHSDIDIGDHYFSRASLFYILLIVQSLLWAWSDWVNLSHITEVSTVEGFTLIRFGAVGLGVVQFAWLAYTRRLSHHWVLLVTTLFYIFYRTFQSVPSLLGQ